MFRERDGAVWEWVESGLGDSGCWQGGRDVVEEQKLASKCRRTVHYLNLYSCPYRSNEENATCRVLGQHRLLFLPIH
jgi:hypothetical protein